MPSEEEGAGKEGKRAENETGEKQWEKRDRREGPLTLTLTFILFLLAGGAGLCFVRSRGRPIDSLC
jgi:hypothetical protein